MTPEHSPSSTNLKRSSTFAPANNAASEKSRVIDVVVLSAMSIPLACGIFVGT